MEWHKEKKPLAENSSWVKCALFEKGKKAIGTIPCRNCERGRGRDCILWLGIFFCLFDTNYNLRDAISRLWNRTLVIQVAVLPYFASQAKKKGLFLVARRTCL
jgi:hypothetical protein